jgi:polysaccharide pyruvyl transferase WcaK-like protein
MDTDQSHLYIKIFVALYPDHDIYYMPCGTDDHGVSDTSIYTSIQTYIPQIQLYDWTTHTLQETLDLFAHASGGIGARLHFLLPLHCFGIRLYALTYAEKITKLITSSITL